MNGDRAAAFADYPELRRLDDLGRAGWRVVTNSRDGEWVSVLGVRVWPNAWVDTIMVEDLGDAGGARRDPDGGVVAERTGSMVDVLDFLLGLPAPDAPGAPRLVKAHRSVLWTPGGAW